MVDLITSIRACTLCTEQLPKSPKPILQAHAAARILIVGQAPGRITHDKGIPFDDPSGRRLRDWLAVDEETFYDERQFAIVPMGFCFPGTGKGGDLPPLKRCAENWRVPLLAHLSNIELTLVIGQYAMDWHLKPKAGSGPKSQGKKPNLTDIVRDWTAYGDAILPLPHPSPRNNMWLKRNAWFESDLLPELKQRVHHILTAS